MATKKQNTQNTQTQPKPTEPVEDKGYSGSSDWQDQNTDQATDEQLRRDRERQRQSGV